LAAAQSVVRSYRDLPSLAANVAHRSRPCSTISLVAVPEDCLIRSRNRCSGPLVALSTADTTEVLVVETGPAVAPLDEHPAASATTAMGINRYLAPLEPAPMPNRPLDCDARDVGTTGDMPSGGLTRLRRRDLGLPRAQPVALHLSGHGANAYSRVPGRWH
jgi:hypothetical protein